MEPGNCENYFSQLRQAKAWNGVSAVIIGRSLEENFDTCLLDALAVAASRSARRDLEIHRLVPGAAPIRHASSEPSREGLALGNWLSNEVMAGGERDAEEQRVSPEDLEYLYGSGGRRASALMKLLRANYAGRRFGDVVDLGAGIGFISCLVAMQPEFGIRRTVLVEPKSMRVAQGTRLWTSNGSRSPEDFRFARMTMQKFPFPEPVDLAIICQSLFYVPAEILPGFIQRAWNALHPGGLFVINERLADGPGEAKRKHGAHSLLQRERLMALLAAHAPPRVYQRRDGWAHARDPMKIAAAELSADSFLVLEK